MTAALGNARPADHPPHISRQCQPTAGCPAACLQCGWQLRSTRRLIDVVHMHAERPHLLLRPPASVARPQVRVPQVPALPVPHLQALHPQALEVVQSIILKHFQNIP